MNVFILFCKPFIRLKISLGVSHTEHAGEKYITSGLQEYFKGVFSSPQ